MKVHKKNEFNIKQSVLALDKDKDNIILYPSRKIIGYYNIHDNIYLILYTKPSFVYRFFARFLLGWKFVLTTSPFPLEITKS